MIVLSKRKAEKIEKWLKVMETVHEGDTVQAGQLLAMILSDQDHARFDAKKLAYRVVNGVVRVR